MDLLQYNYQHDLKYLEYKIQKMQTPIMNNNKANASLITI